MAPRRQRVGGTQGGISSRDGLGLDTHPGISVGAVVAVWVSVAVALGGGSPALTSYAAGSLPELISNRAFPPPREQLPVGVNWVCSARTVQIRSGRLP